MKLKQKKQFKKLTKQKAVSLKKKQNNKPLATLTKRRREKIQITKIRDETENITTDTTEIQNTMRSYFENLYFNKIETTEDIDKFLEAHAPPKLNQENTHKLNRSISSNDTEEVIKSLPTNKSPGPHGFSAEFY